MVKSKRLNNNSILQSSGVEDMPRRKKKSFIEKAIETILLGAAFLILTLLSAAFLIFGGLASYIFLYNLNRYNQMPIEAYLIIFVFSLIISIIGYFGFYKIIKKLSER